MAELIEHPVLTYPEPDGTFTTGHSGTDTSREQAKSGKARLAQSQVMFHFQSWSTTGRTVAELRTAMPDYHHGSISSALTNLHRAGTLARLVEKRDRCHVYVLADCVNGRPTQPPGRVRAATRKAGAQGQPTPSEPQTADLERRVEDADTALAAMATEAYEQGYCLGRDEGWQKGYDQGVDAAQKRPGALLEAKHLGVLAGREQQAARTMALISNMRQQIKGKGPVEAHSATCWQRHPLCAIDSLAKAQVVKP
jgi:hypothetical protein